jgi:hypothetical protein
MRVEFAGFSKARALQYSMGVEFAGFSIPGLYKSSSTGDHIYIKGHVDNQHNQWE